jgi:imidazolonepropionase-like amidohydrolase
MLRKGCVLALALALLPAGSALLAQERPLAFRGAHIIPVGAAPIADGVLVVQNGRITAVGAAGSVSIPANAEVRDLAGKVVMPGLVDSHSHIGGGDGGDQSSPTHGDVRILDAINVRDEGIRRARAGGLTTVNIMPGSGLLMSGQTAYVKLREARTINDLLLCRDPLTEVCGGLKMANGTNPLGTSPRPQTRARSAAIIRGLFVKAQEYREKLRAAGNDASKRPPRDLAMETLVEVLEGRRIVHHHTHRHDDILTALRLAREFGYKVVLQHVSEGWKVAEEIAAAGMPSSIIMIDAPGGKLETVDLSFENGATLERANAKVGFHTDDYITDSRIFLRSAALAVRSGMSRDAALRAVTLANAEMLELDDRVGSLAVGKDADFIVLSGDPFSSYTRVEETWIEGKKVFDLTDPEDRAFAVGGHRLRAGDSSDLHIDWEDYR